MYSASKLRKKNEARKAKIAAIEDFALAETFFALAESFPAPTGHLINGIPHKLMYFSTSAITDEMARKQNYLGKTRPISLKK